MRPYNEGSMHAPRVATLACALLACLGQAFGQAEYRVYREHPRLFLEPSRLDRLRKDLDRQSLRWQALRNLIESEASFPEEPLVDALRFQVEGAEDAAARAVNWSREVALDGIRSATDLRMAALVYDWCRSEFDSAARDMVKEAIAAAVLAVLPQANLQVGLIRAAILGSIAVAGDWDGSESALGELLGTHWEHEVRPALMGGGLTDDGSALIAVLEASLAVRHNLEVDLLRPSTDALAALVRTRLLSYYPLDVNTAEGIARRPSRFGGDESRARSQAPLYRIAEMLLVAYESNLREFQFLQGWIRDDNYQLRSPMAAPYEFLWVNPYLPGLTPQSAPMIAHDPVRGRLYGRLGWERPATWIGFANGRLEILDNGTLSTSERFSELPPMYFPDAVVVPLRPPAKVVLTWQSSHREPPEFARIFLVGLRPFEKYGLKVGGRAARLVEAGAGGILVLRNDPNSPKRDRIDLRKKVRLELRPTLKPTDPRRPRPKLRR